MNEFRNDTPFENRRVHCPGRWPILVLQCETRSYISSQFSAGCRIRTSPQSAGVSHGCTLPASTCCCGGDGYLTPENCCTTVSCIQAMSPKIYIYPIFFLVIIYLRILFESFAEYAMHGYKQPIRNAPQSKKNHNSDS